MTGASSKSCCHKHKTICRQCSEPYEMYVPPHIITMIGTDHCLTSRYCTDMSSQQIEMFIKRLCAKCYDANQQ